jgi:hypothetical protein
VSKRLIALTLFALTLAACGGDDDEEGTGSNTSGGPGPTAATDPTDATEPTDSDGVAGYVPSTLGGESVASCVADLSDVDLDGDDEAIVTAVDDANSDCAAYGSEHPASSVLSLMLAPGGRASGSSDPAQQAANYRQAYAGLDGIAVFEAGDCSEASLADPTTLEGCSMGVVGVWDGGVPGSVELPSGAEGFTEETRGELTVLGADGAPVAFAVGDDRAIVVYGADPQALIDELLDAAGV